MAFQWLIKIIRGKTVTFSPNPLNAAVGDEIVWSNSDTQAHWPGLVQNGQINKTFFMPNQIAPESTSTTFIPSANGTLNYQCSLHPNETGVIQVATPTASETSGHKPKPSATATPHAGKKK